MNIFGSNYEELGSLNKNLVLLTQGKIKIRFGKKFVDLLDEKGNINVKIPKIIVSVDSQDKMVKDGFYLYEEKLYVCLNKEVIQLTGNEEEGLYIKYVGEQELSLEEISTAQRNIGLTFDNIQEALLKVSKGIVFIGNKLYYISNNEAQEINNTLETPLKQINTSELELPLENKVAILYKDNIWQYVRVITYDEFLDFLKNLKFDLLEYSDIFDPVIYSKAFNLRYFRPEIEAGSSNAALVNHKKIRKANGYLISMNSGGIKPDVYLKENDIGIINVNLYRCNFVSLSNFTTDSNNVRYYTATASYLNLDLNILKEEIVPFIVIYKKDNEDNDKMKFFFLDLVSTNYGKQYVYKSYDVYIANIEGIGEVNIIEIPHGNTVLCYYSKTENIFDNKRLFLCDHFYDGNNLDYQKFRLNIDYDESKIRLLLNKNAVVTSTAGDSENYNLHTNHVLIGNISNYKPSYPSVNDSVYSGKNHGLYSNLNVFVGGLFRHPLTVQEARLAGEQVSLAEAVSACHFPRYSKELIYKGERVLDASASSNNTNLGSNTENWLYDSSLFEGFYNQDEFILPRKWIPRAANYIEDLSLSNILYAVDSNDSEVGIYTVDTRDRDLYNGKLFLFKITQNDDKYIKIKFNLPSLLSSEGTDISRYTEPYFLYADVVTSFLKSNALKNSNFKLSTIILVKYIIDTTNGNRFVAIESKLKELLSISNGLKYESWTDLQHDLFVINTINNSFSDVDYITLEKNEFFECYAAKNSVGTQGLSGYYTELRIQVKPSPELQAILNWAKSLSGIDYTT